MTHLRSFDHVGITVDDLDLVSEFFVGLGLEVEGRTFVEGEFLDTVSGIPGSRTEVVMLRPPAVTRRIIGDERDGNVLHRPSRAARPHERRHERI